VLADVCACGTDGCSEYCERCPSCGQVKEGLDFIDNNGDPYAGGVCFGCSLRRPA